MEIAWLDVDFPLTGECDPINLIFMRQFFSSLFHAQQNYCRKASFCFSVTKHVWTHKKFLQLVHLGFASSVAMKFYFIRQKIIDWTKKSKQKKAMRQREMRNQSTIKNKTTKEIDGKNFFLFFAKKRHSRKPDLTFAICNKELYTRQIYSLSI